MTRRNWILKLGSLALLIVTGLSGCSSRSSLRPGPTDDDAPSEFTVTSTGLMYRIRRRSPNRKPGPTDTVTVHYRGWLDGGKQFDSSYARRKPTSFRLDEVVAGWREGLQLIGEGGMIELAMPPELGYGSEGVPGVIPPDANLHFLVELKRIH